MAFAPEFIQASETEYEDGDSFVLFCVNLDFMILLYSRTNQR